MKTALYNGRMFKYSDRMEKEESIFYRCPRCFSVLAREEGEALVILKSSGEGVI